MIDLYSVKECIRRFGATPARALRVKCGRTFLHDNDLKYPAWVTKNLLKAFQGSGVASPVSRPQSVTESVEGVSSLSNVPENFTALLKMCMEGWAKIPAVVLANLVKTSRKHLTQPLQTRTTLQNIEVNFCFLIFMHIFCTIIQANSLHIIQFDFLDFFFLNIFFPILSQVYRRRRLSTSRLFKWVDLWAVIKSHRRCLQHRQADASKDKIHIH